MKIAARVAMTSVGVNCLLTPSRVARLTAQSGCHCFLAVGCVVPGDQQTIPVADLAHAHQVIQHVSIRTANRIILTAWNEGEGVVTIISRSAQDAQP